MDELIAFDEWLASKRALTEPESLLAKAAFHAAWLAATTRVREQCALACDEIATQHIDYAQARSAAAKCAKAIRAS